MEEAVEPDNDPESHDQDPDQSEAEPLPDLSSVELYALRQQKLAERKSTIALIAQDVTENPEQNVRCTVAVTVIIGKNSDTRNLAVIFLKF